MQAKAMSLSVDQRQAIDAIKKWFHEDAGKQCFTLAGFAGTGKTTVISWLVDDLGDRVLITIGTPTGKAAQRLREKGVRAKTIHSLAYKVRGEDEDGNVQFDYRGMGQTKRRLVIIDEASMVDARIYEDLLKNGYRMLFVGDHGQLPPVGTDPGIMRNPDFTLSVIHRQDDSGLLDFAHALREGAWQPKTSGAVESFPSFPNPDGSMRDELRNLIRDADVTLCWKNSTRHELNHAIMRERGLLPAGIGTYAPPTETSTDDSASAEQVRRILKHAQFTYRPLQFVCLRNNAKQGIFNGMVISAYVAHVSESMITMIEAGGSDLGPEDVAVVTARIENQGHPWVDWENESETRGMNILRVVWGGLRRNPKGVQLVKDQCLLDFGYCLTAHKAQGSEWDWVCVWDDTYRSMDDRARWAYTAATRAKRKLSWVRG